MEIININPHSNLNMDLIITLFLGIAAGLMASVPLGPIGILCIQRTLANNRLSGFFSGMGAAIAETFFAMLALYALRYINSFIAEYDFWVNVIGGLIIIVFGMSIFFKKVHHPSRKNDKNSSEMGYVGNFFSVLILTLPNPAYFGVFVWVFAAMGVGSNDSTTTGHGIVLLSGVLLGAALWWFTLTLLVDKLRKKFSYKGLWWLNKISGGFIMLLGMWAVIRVVLSLHPNISL